MNEDIRGLASLARLAVRKFLPFLPISPRPQSVQTFFLSGGSSTTPVYIPDNTDFIRVKAYFSSSSLLPQCIYSFGENFVLPTVSGTYVDNCLISSNDFVMTNQCKVLYVALLNQGYVTIEFYKGYTDDFKKLEAASNTK